MIAAENMRAAPAWARLERRADGWAQSGALEVGAEQLGWTAIWRVERDVPWRRASHPARPNSLLRMCPEVWLYMHVLPSKLVPFPLQSGSMAGKVCRAHVYVVIGGAA